MSCRLGPGSPGRWGLLPLGPRTVGRGVLSTRHGGLSCGHQGVSGPSPGPRAWAQLLPAGRGLGSHCSRVRGCPEAAGTHRCGRAQACGRSSPCACPLSQQRSLCPHVRGPCLLPAPFGSSWLLLGRHSPRRTLTQLSWEVRRRAHPHPREACGSGRWCVPTRTRSP